MSKAQRQKRILELAESSQLKSQMQIMSILRKEGFAVTQSTVSRDLRELHLTKNLSAAGVCRYEAIDCDAVTWGDTLADMIVSSDYSGNNVVLKTIPGTAQAIAQRVDCIKLGCILGCVAGYDTVIIVTAGEEASLMISGEIKQLLKSV